MTVKLGHQDRDAYLKDLLTEVAAGRLGPDEADEQAAEADCGSLSNLFDHGQRSPLSKPFWTIPMVLAWITWKTYSEVREWDRDYLSRRREWGRVSQAEIHQDSAAGFVLFRRKEPNSAQFAQWGNRRFGPWAHMSDGQPAVLQNCLAEHSISALMHELKIGRLCCHAMPRVGQSRVDVPLAHLADIELNVGSSGEDRFCYRRNPTVTVYRDIVFSLPAVLSIWPAHAKSDLDERGEPFSITSMVEDPEARLHLYSEIKSHDLEPADVSGDRAAPKVLPTAFKRLELISKLEEHVDRGAPLMKKAEIIDWLVRGGMSRENARKMYRDLPDALRNKPGRLASRR